MSSLKSFLLLLASLPLIACGNDTAATPSSNTDAAADGAGNSGAIVIRAREGGKNPDRFCMPEWSIANETGTDVGALLIQLEWRTRAGDVLQAVGEFGTLVAAFTAGSRKDLSLNGYTTACSELVLVARTYACRDTNAVRVPCPGPVRAEAPGAVRVDVSGAAEGRMRGAVEAP